MSALLLLGACDSGSGPTGPGGLGPDVGIITDLPAPSSLVGAWVREDELEHRGSPAFRTTEWRFDGRGTCRVTVTIRTADALFPFVEESVCGYQADGRTITFRFDRDEETRVRWDLDGDVLLLDGDRYRRLRG